MQRNSNTKNMTAYCNKCGKQLNVQNGIIMEGNAQITIYWDYFSEKDGEIHRFDICEECYGKLISEFKIPINIVRQKEMI